MSPLPVYMSSPWLDNSNDAVPPREYYEYMVNKDIKTLLEVEAESDRWQKIAAAVMLAAALPAGVLLGLLIGVQIIASQTTGLQ